MPDNALTENDRSARVGDRVKRIHRPEKSNPVVTAPVGTIGTVTQVTPAPEGHDWIRVDWGSDYVSGQVRREDIEILPPEATAVLAPRHRAPIGYSGYTPCCDKSPLELPRRDTITVDNSRVTCAPTPTVVYHWDSRMLPPKPVSPQAEFNFDDYQPRPDGTDSYECALRDIHDDGESTGIGWQDPVDPASDREQWEFVPYYVISYPTAGENRGLFTKPLRVCETCAGQLSGIAPYLLPEADTAKLTDRYAFDYPTADALDTLYYLANAEDPATREPLDLDHMSAMERIVIGSQVLTDVCTPLIASRAVLLARLPYLGPGEFDRLVRRVHNKATRVRDNAANGLDLIEALDNLNTMLTIGTTGATGSPRTRAPR